MTHLVEPRHRVSLDDYDRVGQLAVAVADLRQEALSLVPGLADRRVWMVNSTAHGGGVAELLPPLLTLLRDLGVDANWLVMRPSQPEYFSLTKRLHNLIHDEGDPDLGPAERKLYQQVSSEVAEEIAAFVRDGDVLVTHDPQPLGAGALVREKRVLTAIWRCHIGLDYRTPRTSAAWRFLQPYAEAYDHTVFSAPEYIPAYLSGRTSIIHPGIDPLSHKNRDLRIHKLVGVLVDGGLTPACGPVLAPPFSQRARRLQPDGSWGPATEPDDIGLLFRPIITQVSRWDRLKGFLPLMAGFVALKRDVTSRAGLSPRERRALETVRLVLAGSDPEGVSDDPEGEQVVAEIRAAYLRLPPEMREAIAVVRLPMVSAKENALLVNAVQRCSDIVVQNSLREGFGLTVTEAMWKSAAVVGTTAVGLRQQIRSGVDGVLVTDPTDPEEIARTLGDLLLDSRGREAMGRAAQRRVHDEFLVLTQVRRWLEVITYVAAATRA